MNNEYDEIIVGRSGGDFMKLVEEELNRNKENEREEEQKPLEERLKSKNWKARKNAYFYILTTLKTERCFANYQSLYETFLEDQHTSALESAMEVVHFYLNESDLALSQINGIFKHLLEKCMTNSRANIKQTAKEMIATCFEISSDSSSICHCIKSLLENKNPKIQSVAINTATYLLNAFGSHKFEYRILMPVVEKMTESSNATLRSDILEFYKELYKWTRSSIRNYTGKLKEAIQNDLEKIFEEINKTTEKPQPLRYQRSDNLRNNTNADKSNEVTTKIQTLKEEENMFNSSEEVDVLTRFNEEWATELTSKERKWIEKVDMLNDFVKKIQDVKIKNGPKSHLIASFQKLLKESNINVVNSVINALEALVKGLRKDFTESKEFILPLFEKFKEKREKITNDITSTLNAMLTYCITIEDILDELSTFVSTDKPAQSKERICIFIEKTVLKTYIATLRRVSKPLADILFKLSDDANGGVRSAALKALGTIKFRVGELAISKIINQLCDLKKKKIDEAAEGIFVDPIYNTDDSKSIDTRNRKGINSNDTILKYETPRVDISKKITNEMIKQFNEGNWKIKKEILEGLEKVLADTSYSILPNGLGELITAIKRKLNDPNKNLVRIMINFIIRLIDSLGTDCRQFSKPLMAPILNNLSDKQNLLREDVIKCLEKWAEYIGFENVLFYSHSYLSIDNFEMRNDLLKLIIKNKSCLPKFDCKEIIPGLISCLLDKSPVIRNLAEVLVKETVRVVNVSNFYTVMNNGNYKPALIKTIKPIIDKYSSTIVDTDQMQVDSEVKPEKPKEKQMKSVPPKKRDNNNSTSNDSKKKGMKPQLPMPNIKKYVVNSNEPTDIQAPVQKTLLINNNIKINQKSKRLDLEKSLAFPNEFITPLYINNLKSTMSNYLNKVMLDNAFHSDITKVDAFFMSLRTALQNDSVLILEVMDLILKYILYRNLEFNINHFFNNMVFEFMKALSELLVETECFLSELENKFILEILIIKIFSNNLQLTTKYKQLIYEYSAVIQIDQFIDYFVGKFTVILDEEIRIQFMDILKNIYLSNMSNKKLNDPGKIRLLLNLMSIYGKGVPSERNSKMIIHSLVNEICALNDPEICRIVEEYKGIIPLLPNHRSIQEGVNPLPKLNNSAHFSRSPILKTDGTGSCSKEAFKSDDLIDQAKVDSILEKLYSSDLNKKVQSLLDINDIITNKFEDNQEVLIANINNLLLGMKELLRNIFSQPCLDDTILDLLKYLLLSLYKTALTKELIQNIDINLIYQIYQEILKAILYENLEIIGTQEEGKKAIKSLNAIIMKLLENFNYTDSMIALIKLLESYRSESTKVCSLVIKCLLKMINTLSSIISDIDIHKVLSYIYEYLVEYEKIRPDLSTNNANEDNSLRVLRTLLTEIVKIKNAAIWEIYKAVIEDRGLQDRHLKKWIQVIVRSKNGISMPNVGNTINETINKPENISNQNSADTTETAEDAQMTELNYYIQKLQITSSNEKKALYLDIITAIKKNKLTVEYLKDKIPELDYSQINNFNEVEFKVKIY
jgi:hypothetical protein